MKKQLLILSLAGLLFVSCDPLKAEGDFEPVTQTSESLLKGATFAQFNKVINEDGTESYVAAEDGNYIQFNVPGVPSVEVYYLKKGEKKTLSYGRAGAMIYYMPSRGSDPMQTLYFAFINTDGTEVVAERQFKLQVAQELTPEVKLLVSNSGEKKWRWSPAPNLGGAVWGNGGYESLTKEQTGGADVQGAWWGCGVQDGDCNDKFDGQAGHAGSKYDELKGETYADSYMLFNEDGSITTYSPEGVKITTGSFSVANWNGGEAINALGSKGQLITSAGAILWPFAINASSHGHNDYYMPEEFQIAYLSADRLILTYQFPGMESWEEGTWWSFASDDDPVGVLTSHDWKWNPTEVNGGAVWGNGGYSSLTAEQTAGNQIAGAWWGCGVVDGTCNDKFDGQAGHAGSMYDKFVGETYADSKMTFTEDGELLTYDQNGVNITSGSYKIDAWGPQSNGAKGVLGTSEGAILWPFAINASSHGHSDYYMPTSFQVAYISSEKLVLTYQFPGMESWEEGTWWSFGK